ncbi:MAG TPA: ATP-dependent DNA helicase RecG [Candidatus Avirikenella pullistercoris]|nr:ATP-dependent DNA helicase RecG [Candidatus Avirikenella pullistercoris]
MGNVFNSDIKFLAGIGERRAYLLNKELGIYTYKDLLYHFPYRYIDRTKVYAIREIDDSGLAYVQIKARVERVQLIGQGAKRRFVAQVADATGRAELVWFQGIEWIRKKVEEGREYIIFGKPAFYNGVLSIVHPEIDIPMAESALRKLCMYGIYSSTEKLNKANAGTKTMTTAIRNLWEIVAPYVTETLPDYILGRYNLIPLKEALYNIHFPQSNDLLAKAQYRLKFEELLALQLSLLRQKNIRINKNKGFLFTKVGDYFNRFYEECLPFPLTEAQKRVIREVRADTVSGQQMNRLLQGDVGSGKTIVGLMCMLIAVDNGYQACMMAPTEILATQHYESVKELVEKIGIRVELLTGSTKKKERERIDEGLVSGTIHILIGTHALLEDKVMFSNLGFVIIDEQHRFGVEQRSRLWTKSDNPPHVLVMSATPIPRTLAMTLYGDLDISVIDELPPGRKPIKTLHFYDNRREQVFGFMRDQIARGRQIYVVYPLIKESEKMDYKNVEDGYESIVRAFPPPQYVTVIVHGKMKPADKDYGMQLFKNGQAHIMVATSVIEVGVNVPNASVMVVESAERFGLSQLHQLRGRVGRGAEQSYCILMSGAKLSSVGRKRLAAMVATNDGFELAEMDLKLRGYGDLEGTQQSGNMFDLKIASIGKDNDILQLVRAVAEEILENDRFLEKSENVLLLQLLKMTKMQKTVDFSQIS